VEHVVFIRPELHKVGGAGLLAADHQFTLREGSLADRAADILADHEDLVGPGLHQRDDDPVAAGDEDFLVLGVGLANRRFELGERQPVGHHGGHQGQGQHAVLADRNRVPDCRRDVPLFFFGEVDRRRFVARAEDAFDVDSERIAGAEHVNRGRVLPETDQVDRLLFAPRSPVNSSVEAIR
jgi:hypothetical protein